MYFNNDNIKLWLKTRHFVDDLDIDNDDLMNICQQRVLKLFGFKQILYCLIEHASNKIDIGMMKELYEELKSCKLKYENDEMSEETIPSLSTSDLSNNSSNQSLHNADSSSLTNLDILPDDVLSYICGYLSRGSISKMKICSSRLAIICLEEMMKINVGIFNANELLDCHWNQQQQQLYFVNNVFLQKNSLLKYSRFQSPSNIQQQLEKRYNIPIDYQLICSVDPITKFPMKIVHKIQDIRPRKIERILRDRLELHNNIEHKFLVKWRNETDCTWESREFLKNLRIWKQYQLRKFQQRAVSSTIMHRNLSNNNNANRNNPAHIVDDFVYDYDEDKEEDDDESFIDDYHGCVEFVLFDKRRIIVLSPIIEPQRLSNIDQYTINYDDLKQYRLLFLKYRDTNNCNVDFVQFLLIHPLISKKNISDYIENKFICTSSKCDKCFEQIQKELKQRNIVSDICIDQHPEILISGDINKFGSIITFRLNTLRLCVKKGIININA